MKKILEIEKGKRGINKRGKVMVLEIRMRSRAVLQRLEIERISKIKSNKSKLCLYWLFIFLWK